MKSEIAEIEGKIALEVERLAALKLLPREHELAGANLVDELEILHTHMSVEELGKVLVALAKFEATGPRRISWDAPPVFSGAISFFVARYLLEQFRQDMVLQALQQVESTSHVIRWLRKKVSVQ